MPTSIRLDPHHVRLLRRLAKEREQTQSEVVGAAIRTLAREAEGARFRAERVSAYDRLAHVIGIADSGGADLSVDTGARFRIRVAERAGDRGPRAVLDRRVTAL